MHYKTLRKRFERNLAGLRWIYDCVETAMWAVLIAWVLFMVVFTLPRLPEIWAKIADVRAQEISAENVTYCEKLGMPSGTRRFDECLLTLGDFRLKVEKRVAEEYSW